MILIRCTDIDEKSLTHFGIVETHKLECFLNINVTQVFFV